MIFSLNTDGRFKVTTNLKEYDNDGLDIKCAPGDYNITLESVTPNTKSIIISNHNYGFDGRMKQLTSFVCDLTNSKSYTIIGDDNFLLDNNGIKRFFENDINYIFAEKYMVFSNLIEGAQTRINISINETGIVSLIKIDIIYIYYPGI